MYKTGDKVQNFVCTNVIDCAEIGGTLFEFRHTVNDCPLYWMKTDDDNKLFSVAFRTIPSDNTGVFHILEHSVLNGSEKYPVKEPFVDLLKSSMNTFLNAMTYGEKTIFPVSSRNQKDLNNLMAVYLDAVFKPKIYENPNIFYQEGWHVELNNRDDEAIYKGVVFNEMKGALAPVDAQLEWNLYHTMFEGSCYGFESGGIPESIPELSYENFVATHKKFYHPTNAIFYLDGDLDFEGAVSMISEYVDACAKGEKIEVPKVVAKKGVKKTVDYDFSSDDSPENKSYLLMGKQFGDYKDQKTLDAVTVLSSYLGGSNAAPLKEAVISSGLATDFTIGIESSIKQPVFYLKFDNIAPENADKLKALVTEKIDEIIESGIDKDELSATINHFEFSVYEDPSFKGMANMVPVINTVMFDADLSQTFDFKGTFDFLRKSLDDGAFENLLRELFDFGDYVEILANPSETLAAEELKKESDRLSEYKSGLTDAEIDSLIKLNGDLKKWQESEDTDEARAKLPKLSISDVNPNPPVYKFGEVSEGVLFYQIERKGTDYIDLYFDVDVSDIKTYSEFSFVTRLLLNLPTKNHSVRELRRLVKNYIGTISVSAVSNAPLGETERTRNQIKVSVAVLSKYFDTAMELVFDVLTNTLFDDKAEIRKLLKQNIESLRQSLSSSGHTTAFRHAGASESAEQSATEAYSGYTKYEALKVLDDDFDARIDDYIAMVKENLARTFASKRLTIGVTGNDLPDVKAFAEKFPLGDKCEFVKFEIPARKSFGLIVPAGISYVGKTVNYLNLDVKYDGSMRVLANVLSLCHLWNEIRVMGGAYGAGFRMRFGGVSFFYTYRDPNPKNSMDVFNKSGDFIRDFAESGESIDSFIISTMAELEPLATSAEIGSTLEINYFRGIGDDFQAANRREILGTTAEKLLELADFLDSFKNNGNVCVVGGKALVDTLGLDETVNL